MSGTVGDLSEQQEEILNELKIMLSDVLEPKHDDHLLLQFLRARSFNLKKSENMFRKHLVWRKDFPEEYMSANYKVPEIIDKYCVFPFLGFDKEGSPVRYLRIGFMDLKGVINSCKLNDVKEFAVWCLDTDKRNAERYNEKFGRYVETRTFIIDLGSLSLRQVTKSVLEVVAVVLMLYEANYPENLKVAYVINIPYFFSLILNVMKSILSETTMNKIKIFGKDGYTEELLKLIDPEILPDCCGKTTADQNKDSTCATSLNNPGPVPVHYYLKNQRRLSMDDDGVQEMTVGRRSRKEISVYVDTPDSTILWDIEVSNQDLSFGIFYKPEVGDSVHLEEVVPLMKIGGMYGPACGRYVAKNAGKYVVIFDNGYSLVRSKQVIYRIDVLPPISDDIVAIPY